MMEAGGARDAWQPLEAALDRCERAGRRVDIWLRDDDAVVLTPALARLTELSERHDLPVLLAVIPWGAEAGLARFVRDHDRLRPTQHGFSHRNHAATGERARELGGARKVAEVLADLGLGRDCLQELFGERMDKTLVPPWNRIDDSVIAELPALGFDALSTFGRDERGTPDLKRLNCDLDIIDWRNGRVGHSHAKLATRLADLIEGKDGPIGILTHHLAHDETAWSFLELALARLAVRGGVRFRAADQLLGAG